MYSFNKNDYIVRPISISSARLLIEKYHYAKSASNTATYIFGLFKKDEDFFDNQCIGISWWLPPTKDSAIKTFPEGDWKKVLSLSRLVIHPEIPKNACSFLISKSIKLINKSNWHCLVTYADQWRNHTGTIYRATNWEYLGETIATHVYIKNGKMMGRKRGPVTLSHKEMIELGFEFKGRFKKHKFRMIINKKPQKKSGVLL